MNCLSMILLAPQLVATRRRAQSLFPFGAFRALQILLLLAAVPDEKHRRVLPPNLHRQLSLLKRTRRRPAVHA